MTAGPLAINAARHPVECEITEERFPSSSNYELRDPAAMVRWPGRHVRCFTKATSWHASTRGMGR
jgi:hypothetical protein